MTPEQVRKLLGGYATRTLTDEERQALFAAALDDQELFDTLAREQTLRDLLDDPAARARLLAATAEAKPGLAARLRRWVFRPQSMALAGAVAALAVTVAVLLPRKPPVRERPVQMAEARMHEPAPPPSTVEQPPPPRQPAPSAPAGSRALTGGRADRPAKRKAAEPARRDTSSDAVRPVEQARAAAETAALQSAPSAGLPAPAGQEAKKAEAANSAPPAPVPGVVGGVPGGVVGGVIGGVPSTLAAPPPPPARRAASPAVLARARFAADGATALSYTVLRRESHGRFVPPALGAPLRAGDEVRLRIEAHVAGWVYLMERQGSAWRALGGAHVEVNRPILLPAEGALSYSEPGRREVLILLTPTAHPELRTGIIDSVPPSTASRTVLLEIAAERQP